MQIGEWLGFVINTVSMHFSIPEKKVSKLKNLLNSAISDGYCSACFLAKIAGSVISCALAVGLVFRLLIRQMYFAIETRASWDHAFYTCSAGRAPFLACCKTWSGVDL